MLQAPRVVRWGELQEARMMTLLQESCRAASSAVTGPMTRPRVRMQ
jgi:hypothetical protein